jgi:hypothetical protein
MGWKSVDVVFWGFTGCDFGDGEERHFSAFEQVSEGFLK